MRVLVIGAHPDDYELGMAGTIMKHVEHGDEVFAAIATKGEIIGLGSQRANEARASAKFLGIKFVFFLGLKDARISDGKETIDALEKVIKTVKPQRVYTHYINDTHQDHRNLARATLSACRRVRQILYYEAPSTEIGFEPNYFVDISNYLQRKIDCLNIFKSLKKMGDKRYLEIDALTGGAFFRGYQTNVRYAEAFRLFRFMED